jgi:hypothetical protein
LWRKPVQEEPLEKELNEEKSMVTRLFDIFAATGFLPEAAATSKPFVFGPTKTTDRISHFSIGNAQDSQSS